MLDQATPWKLHQCLGIVKVPRCSRSPSYCPPFCPIPTNLLLVYPRQNVYGGKDHKSQCSGSLKPLTTPPFADSCKKQGTVRTHRVVSRINIKNHGFSIKFGSFVQGSEFNKSSKEARQDLLFWWILDGFGSLIFTCYWFLLQGYELMIDFAPIIVTLTRSRASGRRHIQLWWPAKEYQRCFPDLASQCVREAAGELDRTSRWM